MAVNTYQDIANTKYDSNVNYKAQMDSYISGGGKQTDSAYTTLQNQRDAKLAGLYGNNFQSAINNPSNSALTSDLNRLRDIKIASDTNLYEKYKTPGAETIRASINNVPDYVPDKSYYTGISTDADITGDTSGGSTTGDKSNKSYVGDKPVAQTGNIDEYKALYEQKLAADQAKLKAAIAKARGQYEQVITDAPGQFQGERDTTEVNRYKNMNALREVLANQGQNAAGGVSRTETTNVNTAADTQLNAINMAQSKVINDARKAINDLETQGMFQEAELVAQNAAEQLQAIINERDRVTESNYNQNQDYIQNIMTANQYDVTNKQAADNAIMDKEKFDWMKTTGLAELLGTINGEQTLQGKLTDSELKTAGLQQEGMDISNQTEQLKLINLPDMIRQDMKLKDQEILSNDIKNKILAIDYEYYEPRVKAEIESILKDIESKNLANASQKIINGNLPAKLSAELQNILLTNDQVKAQTANIKKDTALLGTKSGGSGSGGSSGGTMSQWQFNALKQDKKGEEYTKYKGMPAADAKKQLNKDKGSLISDYGTDGYNELYNTIMEDAIRQDVATGNKNYSPKGMSVKKFLGLEDFIGP